MFYKRIRFDDVHKFKGMIKRKFFVYLKFSRWCTKTTFLVFKSVFKKVFGFKIGGLPKDKLNTIF